MLVFGCLTNGMLACWRRLLGNEPITKLARKRKNNGRENAASSGHTLQLVILTNHWCNHPMGHPSSIFPTKTLLNPSPKEQSRIQKLSWIQKLGFRNFFVGFRNSFVGFRNFFVGFRNSFVAFGNFVFRNFLGGFRNSFRWIQKLSSLDSETFFVGFRNFFVGFRNFFVGFRNFFSLDSETFFRWIQKLFRWIQKLSRWIQKLFSLDSETFFVGFRNYFRPIQKLFLSDSETLFSGFTTSAEHRCYTRSGPRVGWGGVGW